MKLSQQPTEYIIVRADSASEWVFPNAAIIQSNPKLPGLGKRMVKLLKELEQEGLEVYKVAFWDNVTFLKIDEDEEDIEEDVIDFLEEDEGWSFVDITEEEITKYSLNKVDAGQMTIDIFNDINWKGYNSGGDEYYTKDIDIEELEQAYTSTQDTITH
jgi:hypothetical protein